MSSSPEAIVRKGGISKTIFIIGLVVVAAASGVTGYVVGGILKPSSSPTITLSGAGATFPNPFISAVISNYSRSNPNVQINYNPAGSGFGVTQLEAMTVDFAASDQPLTATDLSKLSSPAVQIPETVGGVVIAYNLAPTIKTSGLNLTATVAAKIFSGAITYWSDPAIQNLNTVALPNVPIKVVHRGDGSGTTYVFTSWLYTSGTWAGGVGKTANWAPNAYGANYNAGVAGFIQGTNDTIGYVELNYALSATPKMTYCYIQNPANNFIAPSLRSLGYSVSNYTAAFPSGDGNWTSVSLINQPGAQTYPIAAFTYMMVYKALNANPSMTQAKAQALVNFLWFMVHDGQAQAAPLSYVPLPQSVVTVDETTLRSITFNSQTLHS
jgi:phosphate transport system substrate-binding protein